jgi:hypothetical protein
LLPCWPYVLLIFLLLLPMCFSSDLVTFVSYIYLVSLAEGEERTKLIPWKHFPYCYLCRWRSCKPMHIWWVPLSISTTILEAHVLVIRLVGVGVITYDATLLWWWYGSILKTLPMIWYCEFAFNASQKMGQSQTFVFGIQSD